jgi:hypothetical protein
MSNTIIALCPENIKSILYTKNNTCDSYDSIIYSILNDNSIILGTDSVHIESVHQDGLELKSIIDYSLMGGSYTVLCCRYVMTPKHKLYKNMSSISYLDENPEVDLLVLFSGKNLLHIELSAMQDILDETHVKIKKILNSRDNNYIYVLYEEGTISRWDLSLKRVNFQGGVYYYDMALSEDKDKLYAIADTDLFEFDLTKSNWSSNRKFIARTSGGVKKSLQIYDNKFYYIADTNLYRLGDREDIITISERDNLPMPQEEIKITAYILVDKRIMIICNGDLVIGNIGDINIIDDSNPFNIGSTLATETILTNDDRSCHGYYFNRVDKIIYETDAVYMHNENNQIMKIYNKDSKYKTECVDNIVNIGLVSRKNILKVSL